MRAGDWVRFHRGPARHPKLPQPEWEHGLLIEYHKWEKIARILYEGKVIAVRAEYVQLAKRAAELI